MTGATDKLATRRNRLGWGCKRRLFALRIHWQALRARALQPFAHHGAVLLEGIRDACATRQCNGGSKAKHGGGEVTNACRTGHYGVDSCERDIGGVRDGGGRRSACSDKRWVRPCEEKVACVGVSVCRVQPLGKVWP